MKKRLNSVKTKILFIDVLVILPVFILFFVLMMHVVLDSNRSVNESKWNTLNERASNIAMSNDEITRIMNGLCVNTEVNSILSQKTKSENYKYIKNNRLIQQKLLELSVLFYNRKYQIMLLCENGTNYYQSNLEFPNDTLTLDDLKQEEWYQDMSDTASSVYYLPRYRSELLQNLFPEDTVFVVQAISNLNSGRQIGILILAANQTTWDKECAKTKTGKATENSLVIDQQGNSVFPSSTIFGDNGVSECAYYQQMQENDQSFFEARLNKKHYMVYVSNIPGMDWKLISYENYQQYWSLFALLTGLLGIVSLVAIAVMVVFNCNYIYRRMKRLNENILEVSRGNLQKRIQEDYEVEFQEICSNFNTMLDRIEDLMTELERKEKERYVLEFQSLQAQINSHFLHNTLAAIRFMIEMEEYQEADRTLIAFSRLLRKSFADSRRIISLKEELEMVDEYLELMSLRYQSRFVWKISVSVDGDKIGILKYTLQPLVENSISHGFNMKEGVGHIAIRAFQEADCLVVEVEDDGVGADLDKINDCIHSPYTPKVKERFSEVGLANIQKRITKNFGDEFGLKAISNESEGITLQMRFPIMEFCEEASKE